MTDKIWSLCGAVPQVKVGEIIIINGEKRQVVSIGVQNGIVMSYDYRVIQK